MHADNPTNRTVVPWVSITTVRTGATSKTNTFGMLSVLFRAAWAPDNKKPRNDAGFDGFLRRYETSCNSDLVPRKGLEPSRP